MRIGFLFNDSGYTGIDLRTPLDGNNGVGGAQYCFLTLAYSLITYFTGHEIVFFHFNQNELPGGIKSVLIKSKEEALILADKNAQDVLIYRADGDLQFLSRICEYSVDCIAWAHNYLFTDELKVLVETKQIKRVVFVGKEQYDRYIDHDIIKKSTYIYNIFDGERFPARPIPGVPCVTYTGSLIKPKGFHILAHVWKSIIQEVPEAQLYVIGNGQLYMRNAELGSMSVADQDYESEFMPYLMSDGKLLPSVHFCGNMGIEKEQIYQQTTVGVMNPSGRTETFGLSAVEMESCAIPVVTKAANGLYDTVRDGETGFLIKSEKELRQKIILLLKDDDLNRKMGDNAKNFVEGAFSPQKITCLWEQLFEDIRDERDPEYIKPTEHYLNNVKWLRIIIRWLRERNIPAKPMVDIECWAKRMISR